MWKSQPMHFFSIYGSSQISDRKRNFYFPYFFPVFCQGVMIEGASLKLCFHKQLLLTP